MSRPASEIRPFFAAYSNTTTSAYFAIENSTLLSLFAELYLQMSLTILFRAYYFLTYPNRLLNCERPREERNFQSISKNGAKREDPLGYGRVKWQESAISGMRLVLDIREGGTAGASYALRPIYLHLIFEISSSKKLVRRTGFFVYFELDFCRLHKQ